MKYINRAFQLLNVEDDTCTPVWYRLAFFALLIAGFIFNYAQGVRSIGFGYGLGAGMGLVWACEEFVKIYRTIRKANRA